MNRLVFCAALVILERERERTGEFRRSDKRRGKEMRGEEMRGEMKGNERKRERRRECRIFLNSGGSNRKLLLSLPDTSPEGEFCIYKLTGSKRSVP